MPQRPVGTWCLSPSESMGHPYWDCAVFRAHALHALRPAAGSAHATVTEHRCRKHARNQFFHPRVAHGCYGTHRKYRKAGPSGCHVCQCQTLAAAAPLLQTLHGPRRAYSMPVSAAFSKHNAVLIESNGSGYSCDPILTTDDMSQAAT